MRQALEGRPTALLPLATFRDPGGGVEGAPPLLVPVISQQHPTWTL